MGELVLGGCRRRKRPPPLGTLRTHVRYPSGVGSSSVVPYAELHCHSNFSFLDGASHPEELVQEAARLDLEALALTDHDGLYGVVRFAEAASEAGISTVFGAELSLGMTRPQNGVADPEGTHLMVLARDPVGYARLCRALSEAHMAGGEKGRPVMDLATLSAIGAGTGMGEVAPGGAGSSEVGTGHWGTGHWVILTGCRKGAVPKALVEQGPAAAATELGRLQEHFGRDNVVVELWDHGDPLDSVRNDALARIAVSAGAGVVATNNVHYHVPRRSHLAGALAAVRARRSLDEMEGWLPTSGAAYLRSGAEQARRFARYPGVVEAAAELARACAFDLRLVAPKLPPFPTPSGQSEITWLRHLAEKGAMRRYGPRRKPQHPDAWRQIDYELDVIDQLGFAGYFLIVWDIVEFCRAQDIYCQGRGSAANSAVCFALGITKADAVRLGLLFERFLSSERDGPPDIDLDIESARREEVIQYVYGRYGRGCAAQVANVITYRPRSAVRDMGKALGAAQGQLDAWSKQIDAWAGHGSSSGSSWTEQAEGVPGSVLSLASEVEHFPRHLGIHSGGMVIADRPVSEVCPVEWARMPGRSVLQWDKDDAAATGLVKFDLLGLGMLSVLHATVDHIARFHGVSVDLASIPQEDEVYEMLCRADSVGVFQVESRAQMATLPRLKPKKFYDLVVEVALIRPGPIQGGSVHPYIRRRNGAEPVTYLHPLLERSLAKTLGVPLFQEQLMQMAIDVAGFSAADADQLRQAMGSKRSAQRMQRLKNRLFEGMAERGISREVGEQIFEKLLVFANFGFPESHSVSFAYLVYASAWMKLRYPAAFCAGLLDCQPMGFWSPQTIVADARRHGVVVLGPDVNASGSASTLQACPQSAGGAGVRIGLSYVRSMGKPTAEKVEAGRPYESLEDLVRRSGINVAQAEALATAGALGCFTKGGAGRREALWAAGAVAAAVGGAGRTAAGKGVATGQQVKLPGMILGTDAPALPPMSAMEENRADFWALGLSPSHYPTELVREELAAAGVTPAASLSGLASGQRVRIAGVVTHRQRPDTAGGTVFLNLEDETGLANVICSKGAWVRFGAVARGEAALVVDGRVECQDGVVNVLVERLRALRLSQPTPPSRDFR